MRKLTLCVALCSLFVISCKGDSNITISVKDVDFKNKPQDVLKGNPFSEVIGADNIVVFDTLLMVVSSDPKGQLKVYSTNSLKQLGSFCSKGRAKNEFLQAGVDTEQAFYRNGHVILVMYDVPNVYKEVDVTASLQSGSTVVIDSHECLSLADGELMLLGDKYDTRYEFVINKYGLKKNSRRVPSRYYHYTDGKKKELTFFNSLMKSEYESKDVPYEGCLFKHPQKNIVVQSFHRMDYLMFLDFDKDNFFAIHQKGSLTFGDTFVAEKDPTQVLHFTDGASSLKYMMFLYRQGDYTLKETEGKWYPELLIFDWDGNYINGFKIDRGIRTIEYDEIHKVLYGLSGENLFIYELGQLIP